ncbi:MAG TPA: hypothetical protein V6D17_08490 [Candidatus Obscuribacterales bacterium]
MRRLLLCLAMMMGRRPAPEKKEQIGKGAMPGHQEDVGKDGNGRSTG